MSKLIFIWGIVVVVAVVGERAFAGFDVTLWELKSATIWQPDDLPISDSETISDLINPLFSSTTGQVNDNLAQSDYDFAWSPENAIGEFVVTFDHALRDLEVRSFSTGRIWFLTTQDVRVTVIGEATYSHTPGDLTRVNFGASLSFADPSSGIAVDNDRGGNFYFEPASGSLSVSLDAVLTAGSVYQYQYSLDTNNGADHSPTGVADSSGFIRMTIEPVPEPATLLLMGIAALFVLRRGRGDSKIQKKRGVDGVSLWSLQSSSATEGGRYVVTQIAPGAPSF